MMKQIDIYTQKTDTAELWSDVSVKIHGYIMSQIPSEYAETLHKGGIMPFSLYTIETPQYNISRLSILEDKYSVLLDVFKAGKTIRVFGTENNLKVLHVEYAPEICLEELRKCVSAEKYKIHILTPAMYKSNGELRVNPTLESYFESVRQKLEKFEGCCIKKEEMKYAFEQLKICDYRLTVKSFLSGSRKTPGMYGELTVQIPQNGAERAVLAYLLSYATFSGIGGGTTQGMGGFSMEKYKKK